MMHASGSPKSPRVGRTPTAFISRDRDRKLQPQADRPAAVVGMAVAAVGVEVGTRLAPPAAGSRPSGRRAFVPARPRQASNGGSGLPSLAGPADESRLGEGDELVSPVGPRTVQLLGLERQRVFRLIAVARHALAAAVELPDALLFAHRRTSFSAPSAGTRSASA